MQHLGHVRVQQYVHGAHVRKLLLFRGGQVHVARERRVLDHQRQVGHGQAAQDPIDRRAGQVFARQHRDVQQVGQRAEHAQKQADVAVRGPEPQRVPFNTAAAIAAGLGRLLPVVRVRRDIQQVLQVVLGQIQAAQVRHPRVVRFRLGRRLRAHAATTTCCDRTETKHIFFKKNLTKKKKKFTFVAANASNPRGLPRIRLNNVFGCVCV